MDPKADLARRVQERRLELDLSIDRAAEKAGMSPTTWTRVEQGQDVQPRTYVRVDKALGWALGSCRQILEHTEPAPDPQPPAPAAPGSPYAHDPVLHHLWTTPDPELTDTDREALIQVYRALRRTSGAPPASAGMPPPHAAGHHT